MQTKNPGLIALLAFCLLTANLAAQGPQKSYFYSPQTELPWASCHIFFENGSKRKIPFLPVIDRSSRSPLGSCVYTGNIDIEGPVFFAGNGIVSEGEWDCYEGADVTGKVVLFCYDSRDSISLKYADEATLENRIVEAASRGAAAVVTYSSSERHPFLGCKFPESSTPSMPCITVSLDDARSLIETTHPYSFIEDGRLRSANIVANLSLHIRSEFNIIDTEYFTIRFPESGIPEEKMVDLAEINSRAIAFILTRFESLGQTGTVWQKPSITYFNNYDSKVFFTSHWGSGFSSREARGVFSVYKGKTADYPLAVHENTHTFCYDLWNNGGSCSFLNEGIAMFIEAEATDKDANHLKTLQFLESGELPSLEYLTGMDIGSDRLTHIGYPAAGSFAGFVLDRYSLSEFERAFNTRRANWDRIFLKSLAGIEREWLLWLVDKYRRDRETVAKHLAER